MVDHKTNTQLADIYPQDKSGNFSGARRTLAPSIEVTPSVDGNEDPHPPLLRKLLKEYAATGLPPAYIAKDNTGGNHAQ